MADDKSISLREQAAEVRLSAMGERAMLSNPGWLKRHGSDDGRHRKVRQVEVLFAAAATLDAAADALAAACGERKAS